MERIAIGPLLEFYKNYSVPVEVLDLRKLQTVMDEKGRIIEHISLIGDPIGYTVVQVDQHSMLLDLDDDGNNRYRVYDYDANQMKKAHGSGLHRYLISNTVLNANLIVNLPKLKTHIKTGMTSAMKNFVGINGDKAYLPHYRAGSPVENGDDYPAKNFWRLIKTEYRYTVAHWPNWFRGILRAVGEKLIEHSEKSIEPKRTSDPYTSSGGSWFGNDTAWRMVVDLNNAVVYSDSQGKMDVNVHRRWLTIVDAVVAGEGSGPLSPSARKLGYLLAGVNPVEVDFVCAKLMGFNWEKLKYISHGYNKLFNKKNIMDVRIFLDGKKVTDFLDLKHHRFHPPPGWEDFLEIQD